MVAVAAILGAPNDPVIGRTLSTEELRTGSTRDHLDVWEVALHISADHPVVGTGPDTFPIVFADYRDKVLEPDRAQRFSPYRVESAHNIYLAAATGSGIPAALVLAAALSTGVFLACRRSSERPSTPPALLCPGGMGLLAYAITNFFISAEIAGSAIAWILLGSIASVSELAPQSNCTATRARD